MTIEERLQKLQEELKQAIEQVNLWVVRKNKAEGAIEVLLELQKQGEVKEDPVSKDKK